MYIDLNKPLSHDKLFNFIIGARGCGKTYAAKRKVINSFLRSGEEFVYLRRYKAEFKRIKHFFNDIADSYENVFKVGLGNFYIDNKVAGYYLPLSTAITEKSTPYPNVTWIIFDEFIIDTGAYRYLPNEVTAFLEMYSTIARMRDVKVLFLSNSITKFCPYFTYFGLDLTTMSGEFLTKGDILVFKPKMNTFAEKAKETRFGNLIKDTDYGNYAIENEFYKDTVTMLNNKTGSSVLLFILKTPVINYGIWQDFSSGVFYVSYDYNTNCNICYTLDTASVDINTQLVRGRYPTLFRLFINGFYDGRVYFEGEQIKNTLYPLLCKITR